MKLPLMLAGLAFSLAGSPATALLIDFETGGELANNFRKVGGTATATQTSNGAANDYVTQSASNSTTVYLYDTTPADTTVGTQSAFNSTGLSIQLDIRALNAASAGSSFSIFFGSPSSDTNNVGIVFNVDSSGATDQIRFFFDGSMTTTTAGTQVGSSQNVSTGINPGAAFSNVKYTLNYSGTTPTLTFETGSTLRSQTFNAGDYNWGANSIVYVRVFNAAASAGNPLDYDNLQIIPEPSTTVILSTGGLLLIALRRRLSRASLL